MRTPFVRNDADGIVIAHRRQVGLVTAVLTTALLLATSPPAAAQTRLSETPAQLTQISKNPARADDFLRFGFLPPNVVPTTLANPAAVRTFMTYSQFFVPAMPVDEAVRFLGLEPVAANTFLAIRCKEPNLSVLDPELAKWPKVLDAIEHDFGSKYTCPPQTSAPENQLLCIARKFHDTPMTTVTEALANLYDVAAQLTGDPALQKALRTDYGIDVGFSGLGLAVNGSGNPGFQITAENALENASVPEYLVRNVSIAQAGCHCILVPPYPGRDTDLVNPDFIWKEGSPQCTTVSRLPRGDRSEGVSINESHASPTAP